LLQANGWYLLAAALLLYLAYTALRCVARLVFAWLSFLLR
jgi:hypothetical protein